MERENNESRDDWYRCDPDEVFEVLETGEEGLSDDHAGRRHQRHGPNRIREQEGVSVWRVLLDQFTSPLIYVLVGALIVTILVDSHEDAIVIAAVLVLNASIGFFQEYRAESAVQSLMEMVSPRARVRRDGREQEIDGQELVPGDLVLLGPGEVVPADLRLIEVDGLKVDESAITGESVPVEKQTGAIDEENLPPTDQHNMAFMSTAVTSGSGSGVVVEIGSSTEIGRIAEQVEEAGATDSPLEARIGRMARWITFAVLALAALAFVVGLLLGRDLVDMVLLAVALAVSAIPEGLPIVVTVALAIGVSRMAERHAVIRNLHAVDTLGSCTVVLSDKTGTLTQNQMGVEVVVAGGDRYETNDDENGSGWARQGSGEPIDLEDDVALRETFLVGLLCNETEPPETHESQADDQTSSGEDGDETEAESPDDATEGDPMELALLSAAHSAGLSPSREQERYPLIDIVPFDAERRFMATIHEADGTSLVLVKGAPEVVVSMCHRKRTSDGDEVDINRESETELSDELASDGLRVLAMAIGRGDDSVEAVKGDDPHGLVLVGMQGLMDPPRPNVVEAVDACHRAGIRVAMVTGDHAATARAIARQVHLNHAPDHRDGADSDEPEVVRGQELAALADDDFEEALTTTVVFARVAPGQKLRLVEGLKQRDEIVAVTGDGVNDAPALKSAHLGAAMGSGTDVAKEASDMVITDDNFVSVYSAVEEGRTAFRNIRMATFFLLSTGVAEVIAILAALVLDWPLPLLPAQILWLNVVTNGIDDIALAFEPGEQSLFRQPPRPTNEGILNRKLIERLALIGGWFAIATILVFWWQWNVEGAGLTQARTTVLTMLVMFQSVHIFNCRSEDDSVFSKSLFTNKILLGGVLGSLAIHIAAIYFGPTQRLLSLEPINPIAWLVAAVVASTAVLINEGHKRWRPSAR